MTFASIQACGLRPAYPALEASSRLYPSLLVASQATRRTYWSFRCSKPRSPNSVRRTGSSYPELLKYRSKWSEVVDLDDFLSVKRGYAVRSAKSHPDKSRVENDFETAAKCAETEWTRLMDDEIARRYKIKGTTYELSEDSDATDKSAEPATVENTAALKKKLAASAVERGWEETKKEMREDFQEIRNIIGRQPYKYLFGASERRGVWNPWKSSFVPKQNESTSSTKETTPDEPVRPRQQSRSKVELRGKPQPSPAQQAPEHQTSELHNQRQHPINWITSEIQWVRSKEPLMDAEEYYIDPITSRKVRRQSPARTIILPEPTSLRAKDDLKQPSKPKEAKAIDVPVRKFSPKISDLGREEIMALAAKPQPRQHKLAGFAAQSWLARNGFTGDTEEHKNGSFFRKSSLNTSDSAGTSCPSKPLRYSEVADQTEDLDLLRASDVRAAAGRTRLPSQETIQKCARERRKELDEVFSALERKEDILGKYVFICSHLSQARVNYMWISDLLSRFRDMRARLSRGPAKSNRKLESLTDRMWKDRYDLYIHGFARRSGVQADRIRSQSPDEALWAEASIVSRALRHQQSALHNRRVKKLRAERLKTSTAVPKDEGHEAYILEDIAEKTSLETTPSVSQPDMTHCNGSTGEFYSDNDAPPTIEPTSPVIRKDDPLPFQALTNSIPSNVAPFNPDGAASQQSVEEIPPPISEIETAISNDEATAASPSSASAAANLNPTHASSTLDEIEKHRAPNQRVYVALAIDRDLDVVVVARASSSLHGTSSAPRSPASILTHLDKPYKYFELMERLEALDYELIAGSRNMLVYQKICADGPSEAAPVPAISSKQINEVSKIATLTPAPQINLRISTSAPRMVVRRTEALFSGGGRVRARQPRHRSQQEIDRSPIRKAPKPTSTTPTSSTKAWTFRKKIVAMLAAGVVTSGSIYTIGLLLEYFKLFKP